MARALSSYNMDRRRFCDAGVHGFSWDHVCPAGSFSRAVRQATDPQARGSNCFFDGMVCTVLCGAVGHRLGYQN